MTIFLVTLLLGSNFMPIWYFTSLNTIFGIAAYIACHVYRYAGNGVICAEEQEFRASMLMAEVIVFWTTFHIMSCPQIFFFFMSTENLDSALVEEEEEEGEEGEGEKEWEDVTIRSNLFFNWYFVSSDSSQTTRFIIIPG